MQGRLAVSGYRRSRGEHCPVATWTNRNIAVLSYRRLVVKLTSDYVVCFCKRDSGYKSVERTRGINLERWWILGDAEATSSWSRLTLTFARRIYEENLSSDDNKRHPEALRTPSDRRIISLRGACINSKTEFRGEKRNTLFLFLLFYSIDQLDPVNSFCSSREVRGRVEKMSVLLSNIKSSTIGARVG